MNPHIFRKYDIRGRAADDLPNSFALDLGRAIGTFHRRAGRSKLALGRDCRLSSDRLHEALTAGLLSTGVSLVDIGVVPTPQMYFAVHALDLEGGVQITGSHNPPEDNGFKMMKGKGSLFGEDIIALRTLMETGDYDTNDGGSVEHRDVSSRYVGFVQGNVDIRRPLRIAVDAGNGASGPIALQALEALGLEITPLLCEMDGTFPVHHPDPTQLENLELLKETVLRDKLDFGVALDGDGDRIGVVDGAGNVLWGDRLVALYARDILSRREGAAVIGEVKCSQSMYDDIAAHGGRPIVWKTGHSLIKAKMKEEKALLAGEMSGHIFFKDRFFGFDDAVYAAARLAEIVASGTTPLSELLSDLPALPSTPELRIECPDDVKFELVDKVRSHFQKTHDVVDIDGARIRFEGGWGLVRASNTQPVLVTRFEARTQDEVAQIRSQVEQVIESARASMNG